MQRLKKLLARRTVGRAFVAIGILGSCISAYLYFNQPRPPMLTTKPQTVHVDPAPSSTKPSPQVIAQYSVPPTNPKYIAIPVIGITNTPVRKLGLLKTGAIATPDNIYEAGWYAGSALPGHSGAMFIYGHVSSWAATGLFYNLKKLVAGDKIILTRGDNTIYRYQVVSTKSYPYNAVAMNQVLSPINPTKPGLNLMTCSGHVIAGTNEFSERLVVFTQLANN